MIRRSPTLASLLCVAVLGCAPTAARCVTGAVVSCPCGAGVEGTQQCSADGTFGECRCSAGDAGQDAGFLDGAAPDAASRVDAPTPVDAAVPAPHYGGLVPDAPSVWSMLAAAEGRAGLDAGDRACQLIGADHVCDYEEVLLADAAGELAAIPIGTSAWLQRTTTVDVGGVPSAAGQGGNCVDWTFTGNHLADGEYITFESAGEPTYHFDSDTAYDLTTNHAQPGDLDCGGVNRAILCCNLLP